MSWRLAGVLALGLAVLVSAFAIVASQHENRRLFQRLVQLERQRDALDIEWGRLQLEQAALSTPAEVELRARRQLSMKTPGPGETVMVVVP